jgi:propionyl-CoA carboxylase alpha chain
VRCIKSLGDQQQQACNPLLRRLATEQQNPFAGAVEIRLGERFPNPQSSGPAGGLVAPMPGKITDVRAAVGDTVAAGQVLVIMEAMKMEHHLSTPTDGVVAEVRVQVGEQVDNGAVVLVVEPAG